MSTPSTNHAASVPRRNPQLVPFLVLVGVVATVGILFFQVIRPLFMPLFLAGVIAMLCHPLQDWLTALLRGRARIAAGLVTTLILLMIIVPVGSGIYVGVAQLYKATKTLQQQLEGKDIKPLLNPKTNPRLAELLEDVASYLPINVDQLRDSFLQVARAMGEMVYTRTMEFISDLPGVFVGGFMFVVALYYFLVDGPSILAGWSKLTPLESEHDQIIRDEFVKVCRGVVLATLIASAFQGLLLGIGLTIEELIFGIGLGRWSILLSLLTMVFAMVPFVGAAAVWVPTMIYLFIDGQYAAAICLAIYGAVVVSTADNLIKVIVLKGSASLHPLLVFVCVFGGIHLFGILGIFIGPIVGAVLFALMRILKGELLNMNKSIQTPSA
ncbi:MAG: AI-2E family transporter [Planctomycetota bacterium]